jgi:hypothetical protein
MFSTLDFYGLRINESYEYVNRFLKLMDKQDLDGLGLQPVVSPLRTSFAQLDEGIQKGNTVLETQTVKEADKGRDNGVRGMVHYCKAYSYSEDEQKRYSANVLLNAIGNYGDIINVGYDAQSAKLSKLLNDLESIPKLIAAVTNIEAEPFVGRVRSSQGNFVKSVEERLDHKSTLSVVDNKEVLKDIKEALDTIFQYIDVMQKVTPREEFTKLVKDINLLIDETMAPLLIRQGRKAAKDDEENNE